MSFGRDVQLFGKETNSLHQYKNILLGPDSDLQTSRPLKLKANSRANFRGCGVLTYLTNIYCRPLGRQALSHRIMLCDKTHPHGSDR